MRLSKKESAEKKQKISAKTLNDLVQEIVRNEEVEKNQRQINAQFV